jgi:IS5 family transposase
MNYRGSLDATFYVRDRASRHYCHRTNYHVQTPKFTKLIDTESQAILDVHCSTTLEGSDADLCEQIAPQNAGDLRTLAADKGYDKNAFCERVRELEIRPLTKHCIRAPYDHAHNARIDEELYAQRSMTETVNSAVKRSHGGSGSEKLWRLRRMAVAWLRTVAKRSSVTSVRTISIDYSPKPTTTKSVNG